MLQGWREQGPKWWQHGRDQEREMGAILHTRFIAIREQGKPVGQR